MEKTTDNIERVNAQLARLNSPWYQFYLSVIRGIGTAVGVTIIGGLAIGILNQLVDSVYDIPIINKIIEPPFEIPAD